MGRLRSKASQVVQLRWLLVRVLRMQVQLLRVRLWMQEETRRRLHVWQALQQGRL